MICLLDNCCHALPGLGLYLICRQKQMALQNDGAEHIVEVVRNARRHLTHAGQALLLVHLRLQIALLRDVADKQDVLPDACKGFDAFDVDLKERI
ncbi:MAG: hypothetical protein R2856_27620 [Caldilineaceae bacterium]